MCIRYFISRSTFIDYPRKRPKTQKPESYFDFFDKPRKASAVPQPIIANKFNNSNVAVIEPSKNVHHSTGINGKVCSYLCQPEVRKARHEILKKKRPPSPTETVASSLKYSNMRKALPTNDENENRLYMEKSRIIPPTPSPPIVTIENFDEPDTKPITIIRGAPPNNYGPSYGRRASTIHSPSIDAKNSYPLLQRNQTKIIEGNHEYVKSLKKNSMASIVTSADDEFNRRTSIDSRKLSHSQSLDESPSFVVLKEPCKQNKWMKSNWYM